MQIKSDNTSPINSDVYDSNIRNTLPYYDEFRGQILDVLTFMDKPYKTWLDLGCGTGSLAEMALEKFPDMEFTLADPAGSMLEIAKSRLGDQFTYICAGSQELEADGEKYDIITAVQSHHYLQKPDREKATKYIYESLKHGGIYFCFENVLQTDEKLADFEYRRWLDYRFHRGFDSAQLPELLARLNTKFFPITIPEHIDLLKRTGFDHVALFWLTYNQMGLYALKD